MASGGSKQTSTTTIPQWMSDAGQSTFKDATAYNNANPITPYTGQQSAPQQANITQANQQAAASVGTGQGQVGAGTTMAQQAGGQRTDTGPNWQAAGVASSYMNPYVQNVQQNTLRTMGRQATINQGEVNNQAAAAHAFGGDRHGIVAAEQAKNDAQQAQDYIDQSNAAAYGAGQSQYNADRATNIAAQQGDRDAALQASGILGNLGNTSAGIASSDAQRLLQSGLSSQDIAQQADDAAYQEYLRQQNAPMDRYSQLAGILSGTPYGSSTTQKTPGSIMNTVLGVGGIAASIFSDVRLKDNIVATGDKWHGLPVFEFDYRDMGAVELPKGRHRGVMAQDAILEYPNAVSVGNNGYLQIDYGQIARSDIQ
jgi:hypothetical protein